MRAWGFGGWSSKFFSRRRSAPPSPIRRSGGEKGRNFRQVRQLSFHGSRDALVRSDQWCVPCKASGSAPSLCYCFPCLPGQSLALLRVGGFGFARGQLCLCVGPLWDPSRSLLRPHGSRGCLYFMSRKMRALRGFLQMGVGYRVRVNMERAILFA
jgi:hypothetical protein